MEKNTKLAPHATKCIFLSYGTDGEFSYKLLDMENQKLIQSSDVVFNEDSIFSRNQQKIVGKKVTFEIDTNVVEGPTHMTELEIPQTIEINQANPSGESESTKGPLVKFDSIRILTRNERKRVELTKSPKQP